MPAFFFLVISDGLPYSFLSCFLIFEKRLRSCSFVHFSFFCFSDGVQRRRRRYIQKGGAHFGGSLLVFPKQNVHRTGLETRTRLVFWLNHAFLLQVRCSIKNVVKFSNSAHKCALAHLEKCVVCLSLFFFLQAVGVLRSPLPTFLFKHLSMGQVRKPPTQRTTLSSWSVLSRSFGRATAACVSSPGDWAVSTGGQLSWASASKRTLSLVLGISYVEQWIQQLSIIYHLELCFLACFTRVLFSVGQPARDFPQRLPGEKSGRFPFPFHN